MLSTSDQKVIEALSRLQNYVNTQPGPKSLPRLSIAISRQAGSSGADIARAVGTRLGWSVYDHEILTRIAEEKGLSARLLERLDERCAGWLEEIFASFSIKPTPSDWTYLKYLLKLFSSLSDMGHCVIVGRGACHVLPVTSTLLVRLVAPHNTRVLKAEKWLGVSRAEAVRWVDHTDNNRSGFVKTYFRKDPADPLHYDLVLNSGHLSMGDCVELIVQAARLKEVKMLAS